MDSGLKVALVHDWLTGMRGGEKVLEVLCELYPGAPLFTLLHNKGSVSPLIEDREIHASFIDRLPLKARNYRNYLPLFPRAIESLDVSRFDVILSTSHAVAKGIRKSPGALHVCYCHTPMRYVWELYDQYFGQGRAGIATRTAMSFVAPRLRRWDVRSNSRVTAFIANSLNVADRIRQYYDRSSTVIYPPVSTDLFTLSAEHDGYDLIVSALVPYKRVDLAVETYNRNARRLLVVGTGPEAERLRPMAASNIEFLGWRSDQELVKLYARCRALIFPGIEDFGIVPLEAMASGKPVVAFGKGGALETVVDDPAGGTGVFFTEQTPGALQEALEKLENRTIDAVKIRNHAGKFDRRIFKEKYSSFVEGAVKKHFSNQS